MAAVSVGVGNVDVMDRMEWLYLVGVAVVLVFGLGVVLRNRRGGRAEGPARPT
ncbi:MAG: hypothetical protein RIR49_1103, partial [Actinomycetota bacterium]